MRRRFEFREGTSNKFWEIERQGDSQIVRFGRMGTDGQTKKRSFLPNKLHRRHLKS
jgi:predicted DNA-binding WGR domain protein